MQIDHHIHFEHQPYTLEIIDNMVKTALENKVDVLYLLDHTHKFKEFQYLYENTKNDPTTYSHYQKEKKSIQEYLDFIKEVKARNYPVKLLFGLEVCYFEQENKHLKEDLDKYNLDFYIGSVHHIDGFAFDFHKEDWEGRDVDKLYVRYFAIMESLIKSRLFTHLAHPDSIKVFDFFPSFSLLPYYERIAKLLKEYNMTTENNTGFARYGFTNYGIDKEFLRILKDNNITVYKSSDAHQYKDIGNKFDEIEDNLK